MSKIARAACDHPVHASAMRLHRRGAATGLRRAFTAAQQAIAKNIYRGVTFHPLPGDTSAAQQCVLYWLDE